MREYSRIRRFKMMIAAQTMLIAVLAVVILIFVHTPRTSSVTLMPANGPAEAKLLPGASTTPTLETKHMHVPSLKAQAFLRQI